jgi:hypothetical protein
MGKEIRGEIGSLEYYASATADKRGKYSAMREPAQQAAWCTAFSRSQHLLIQTTNSQSLTEPGGSVLFAQKVAFETHPETGEYTSHRPLTDCILLRFQLHLHNECLDFSIKLNFF